RLGSREQVPPRIRRDSRAEDGQTFEDLRNRPSGDRSAAKRRPPVHIGGGARACVLEPTRDGDRSCAATRQTTCAVWRYGTVKAVCCGVSTDAAACAAQQMMQAPSCPRRSVPP